MSLNMLNALALSSSTAAVEARPGGADLGWTGWGLQATRLQAGARARHQLRAGLWPTGRLRVASDDPVYAPLAQLLEQITPVVVEDEPGLPALVNEVSSGPEEEQPLIDLGGQYILRHQPSLEEIDQGRFFANSMVFHSKADTKTLPPSSPYEAIVICMTPYEELAPEEGSADTLTDAGQLTARLSARIRKLFFIGENEPFDFGCESPFSRQLTSLISEHGNYAISALERFFSAAPLDPHLVAEALLWMGDMVDRETQQARRALLLRQLSNDNIIIRCDAITALKLLGDPNTLPAVREAWRRESVPELKKQLENTVRFLEKAPIGSFHAGA